MHMDRVGVHGGVVDLPDLRAVQERGLGDRIAPSFRYGDQIAPGHRSSVRPAGPDEAPSARRRFPGIVGVAAAQLARKFGSPGVVLKSVPMIASVTASTSTQTWSEDNSLRDTWRVFVAAPSGASAGRTRFSGRR